MLESTPAYPATLTIDSRKPSRTGGSGPVAARRSRTSSFSTCCSSSRRSSRSLVFAIVITGNLPEGLAGVQVMYMRYGGADVLLRRISPRGVPPVHLRDDGRRSGRRPARARRRAAGVDRPEPAHGGLPESSSSSRRRSCCSVLVIAALCRYIIAFFAVLFTGRWPDGMRDFVINVSRGYVRVMSYGLLLNDAYPAVRAGLN